MNIRFDNNKVTTGTIENSWVKCLDGKFRIVTFSDNKFYTQCGTRFKSFDSLPEKIFGDLEKRMKELKANHELNYHPDSKKIHNILFN